MNNYDSIQNIILPTLGEERKKTYSPFLPICKETGKVLMASVIEIDKKNNSILYLDEVRNKEVETSVLSGNCKLQWKVDWAMRWMALGVDYEMAGNLAQKIIQDSFSKVDTTNCKNPFRLFIWDD